MILEDKVYCDLKKQVMLSVGSSTTYKHLVSSLKDHFRHEINSNRRYEQITTILELIRTLEDRDALSEDNVEPLKAIAQRVPNNTNLLKTIEDYETSHVALELMNYYAPETTPNISSVPGVQTANTQPYGSNISPRKKQRINETIIEEIGTFWRFFGRNLGVRECVIDEIDNNNNTIGKKATKILEIYEQRADPQRGFLVLCEALERAHRKDLSRSVQEIMTMNI